MRPRFSCVTAEVRELPLSLFASEEVDATLGDGFYYYCFIHKKN